MSSRKRQATTPTTIINLDHVLTAIARCIPAAKDVMAFLAALPASSHSRPLAALHELLQDPRRHVLATEPKALEALWPLLHLDLIMPAATSLVRDALPVFRAPALWLALWSSKLTHYKHVEDDVVYDRSQLISILRQCHKLQVVDTTSAIDASSALALFEAVTTPLHGARSLAITSAEHGSTVEFIGMSMSAWIRRGAWKISFFDGSIRDAEALVLASALPRTTSPRGVVLEIKYARLSVQGYLALGEALATCRGVSIELPSTRSKKFRTEAFKRNIRYQYGRTTERTRCIVLESPVAGA